MYVIMSPKRILIVGTMVLTFTAGVGLWSKESISNVPIGQFERSDSQNKQIPAEDHFLQALGASSNEEVYDSLLQGKSLADIADDHHADVNNIINLQIAELTEQLDSRLAAGSLLPEKYHAQKAELADIVKKSVYRETTT